MELDRDIGNGQELVKSDWAAGIDVQNAIPGLIGVFESGLPFLMPFPAMKLAHVPGRLDAHIFACFELVYPVPYRSPATCMHTCAYPICMCAGSIPLSSRSHEQAV